MSSDEKAQQNRHVELMRKIDEAADALIENVRRGNWQEDLQADHGPRIHTFSVTTGTPDQPQLRSLNSLPGREELLLVVEDPTARVSIATTAEALGDAARRIDIGLLEELGQFITLRWPMKTPLWLQSSATVNLKVVELRRGNR